MAFSFLKVRLDPLVQLRPWSAQAILVALACLAGATSVRVVLGWFGVTAPFGTFFPAVLVTALLAGTPAAIAVIMASVFVVWWTFLPPPYQFNPIGAKDIANITLFIISSGLIIVVAQLYRTTLQQLQNRNSERELLMRELEHRGRNTYAIVETIVRNTLAADRDKADIIAARVRAVSSANDLVNWSNTRTVSLLRLLALVFGANAERISVSGADVELSPAATRTLSLVFHELLINAMKYGALSNPSGSIAIHWVSGAERVALTWVESGGPEVSRPDRTGFGTTVMTRSLAALSGDIDFAFNLSGLRCGVQFDPNA